MASVLGSTTLRAVRIARGEGLREVARRAGIDAGALSRIERGLREPRTSTLRRIFRALELSKATAPRRPVHGPNRPARHRPDRASPRAARPLAERGGRLTERAVEEVRELREAARRLVRDTSKSFRDRCIGIVDLAERARRVTLATW